jgi:predicted PurR-regulated permease PerM
MPFLDTNHQRAAVLIAALGIGIAVTLSPYATGLIGGPVLYVIFAPLNEWLRARMHRGLAAGIVILLAILAILLPLSWFATLVVGQAQDMARSIVQSPVLDRVAEFRIGAFELGPRLAAMGESLVSWLGGSAFGLIGTATRLALNLTIAFFVLYFLLVDPQGAWKNARPFIPFSPGNADKLQKRFRDVTNSTLIGTGLIAIIQGALVALAFVALGFGNAMFWGLVTAIFAVLPLLGSGLIWGPAVVALLFEQRFAAAIGLAVWGILVVGTTDNLVRPIVYRRWAQIHPLVTLVGAIAGVRYFGLLGILIGPLALSYFFELIRMYGEEYVRS